MRTFATMEELFAEVEKVMSMEEQELENYEKEIDFCSFGRMTDAIYYPIVGPIVENELEFDIDQAREYVIQYPEYLEIITDEDGEYEFIQKYRGSFFRYVMNGDRLFQVGESVYKVFNDVVISATIGKSGNLSNITEGNIERFVREINSGEHAEMAIFGGGIRKAAADDDDTTSGKKSRLDGAKQIFKPSRLDEATQIITVDDGSPAAGPCGRQYGTHGRYKICTESPVASNNQEKVVGIFYCRCYEYFADFQCIASINIYAKWRGKCKGCVWIGCKRTINMDFHIEIWHENTRYTYHHQHTTPKPTYDYGKTLFDKMGAYDKGKVFRSSIYNLCGRYWIATTERRLDE